MKILTTLFVVFMLTGCAETVGEGTAAAVTSTGKDACDDPDADIDCYFVNMPAQLNNTMTITKDHTGDPLQINGRFLDASGRPLEGVIMYAYHTDDKGYYTKKGNETGVQKWHGYLHGWCRTNADGRYTIKTIRPAPYPAGGNPAHIHAAVKVPGRKTPIFITDFVFADDPIIKEGYRAPSSLAGGPGILQAKKTAEGIWQSTRDITIDR